MTAYALSTNPNVTFNPATDIFSIDTTSASHTLFAQVGANVVVTDDLGHTATLQGVLLTQFAPGFNVIATDGSAVQIGDQTFFSFADENANTINGTALGDYIMGLGGDDNINGGDGSDKIYGNQGNDNITGTGTAGSDTVFGGQGNDVINYAGATSGSELIYGNLGNDIINGGGTSDTIFGGQGNDSIVGSQQAGATNLIYGGLGLDTIVGGDGKDTIFGGDNDDKIYGDNTATGGADLIYGNQGDDLIATGVTTAPGNDTVFGGQGSDSIDYANATAGNNELIYGNLGNDTILSGAGSDTLFGGQGNDSLDGGLGKDSMSGGVGNDTFVERSTGTPATSDSGITTASADVITDFTSGSDKIREITTGPGTNANYQEYSQATVTTVETAVSSYATAGGTAKLYTFIAGATDGYLVVDANGDHAADSVIVLKGVTTLAGFDFTDII